MHKSTLLNPKSCASALNRMNPFAENGTGSVVRLKRVELAIEWICLVGIPMAETPNSWIWFGGFPKPLFQANWGAWRPGGSLADFWDMACGKLSSLWYDVVRNLRPRTHRFILNRSKQCMIVYNIFDFAPWLNCVLFLDPQNTTLTWPVGTTDWYVSINFELPK